MSVSVACVPVNCSVRDFLPDNTVALIVSLSRGLRDGKQEWGLFGILPTIVYGPLQLKTFVARINYTVEGE